MRLSREGVLDAILGLMPGWRPVPREVETGAEATASAGENNDSASPIDSNVGQSRMELGDERRIQGIETSRSVQSDPGDTVLGVVNLQRVHAVIFVHQDGGLHQLGTHRRQAITTPGSGPRGWSGERGTRAVPSNDAQCNVTVEDTEEWAQQPDGAAAS